MTPPRGFYVVDPEGRLWFGCFERDEAERVLFPQNYNIVHLPGNGTIEVAHERR